VVDLLLILAVAAGIVGGAERGAVVGFFAGLAMDLMLPSPMGLGALSYLVAGAVAGLLHAGEVRSARWRTMVIAAVGCAVGVLAFAVGGAILGRSGFLGWHLVSVVLVVSVGGAVLSPLAVRLCHWADGDADRLRPALR
jgi:rod shape-determining protein MreD